MSLEPTEDVTAYHWSSVEKKKEAVLFSDLLEDTHVAEKGGHPRFHEILGELSQLHNRKNHDYAAGGKQGPLGNFERTSTIMSLYPGMDWDSPFGVAMAYMLKQLDAAFILRAQKRKSITGEPIPARLKDVATYTVIGMVIAEEEENLGKAHSDT